MKKVHSADSLITISHYKNILLAEGIEAFVQNEHLGSAMGEVPFFEIWPELWVQHDHDYERARQLIDEASQPERSPQQAWACRQCGEFNEGQFAACWNCGAVAE